VNKVVVLDKSDSGRLKTQMQRIETIQVHTERTKFRHGQPRAAGSLRTKPRTRTAARSRKSLEQSRARPEVLAPSRGHEQPGAAGSLRTKPLALERPKEDLPGYDAGGDGVSPYTSLVRKRRMSLPFQLMPKPKLGFSHSKNYLVPPYDFAEETESPSKLTRSELMQLLDTLAEEIPDTHRNRMRFGLV